MKALKIMKVVLANMKANYKARLFKSLSHEVDRNSLNLSGYHISGISIFHRNQAAANDFLLTLMQKHII